MSKTKKIIFASILLALLIVLSRFFSIKTQLLVISFKFIPIMICAIYLGPKYTTLIAALGDFIGAILFPFGTYFPGFTISAAIGGFIYGIILYRKENVQFSNKQFLIRLILSSLLSLTIVEIGLYSLCLNIMYGKAFLVVASSRILVQAIMFFIQIPVIYGLDKLIYPIAQKNLYE